MRSASSVTHIEGTEYIDLPRYGVHAGRDRRSAELPAGHIPFKPTHRVKITFRDITFHTSVKAESGAEAERLAMVNLRYTFWPEQRLREIGPVLDLVVYGPRSDGMQR